MKTAILCSILYCLSAALPLSTQDTGTALFEDDRVVVRLDKVTRSEELPASLSGQATLQEGAIFLQVYMTVVEVKTGFLGQPDRRADVSTVLVDPEGETYPRYAVAQTVGASDLGAFFGGDTPRQVGQTLEAGEELVQQFGIPGSFPPSTLRWAYAYWEEDGARRAEFATLDIRLPPSSVEKVR